MANRKERPFENGKDDVKGCGCPLNKRVLRFLLTEKGSAIREERRPGLCFGEYSTKYYLSQKACVEFLFLVLKVDMVFSHRPQAALHGLNGAF